MKQKLFVLFFIAILLFNLPIMAQSPKSKMDNHIQNMMKLCKKDQLEHITSQKIMEPLLCGKDLEVTIAETKLEFEIIQNSVKPEYLENMKKCINDAKKALNNFEKEPYLLSNSILICQKISLTMYLIGLFNIEKDEKMQVLWGRYEHHLYALGIAGDALLMQAGY